MAVSVVDGRGGVIHHHVASQAHPNLPSPRRIRILDNDLSPSDAPATDA